MRLKVSMAISKRRYPLVCRVGISDSDLIAKIERVLVSDPNGFR